MQKIFKIAAMPNHFDVLFLGSGQADNALAKSFARAGRTTAMVERSSPGGTCLNTGCTPSKIMIASGRVAHVVNRAGEFGITVTESAVRDDSSKVAVDMARVRQRKRDIVTSWSGGMKKGLETAGVHVVMGQGRFVGPKEVEVALNEGGGRETLTADAVFISTGERPRRPSIPGLDGVAEERVLDSTSVMELGHVPSHLVVIGGGPIGVEFAQLFRRLGARVTVIQGAAQLVPREDADVAQCLRDVLVEDGIDVRLNSRVRTAAACGSGSKGDGKDNAFELQLVDGGTIQGSHLLLATGRVPNTDTLNLEAVGVRTTSTGHVVVDDTLRTSAPGVYALGDVHGGPAFTHMSFDDSRIIQSNLLNSSGAGTSSGPWPRMPTTASSSSRALVPYVTFTDPQLAHVGLHERDLAGRQGGSPATKTAVMPMSYVARANETAETRGMLKATVDSATGQILGFTCLGPDAGELMATVQTAIMGRLTWRDLESAVYAHPTTAECLNNLWAYLE